MCFPLLSRLSCLVLLNTASVCDAYQLFRPSTPPAPGLASIVVPAARVLAPGQRAQLHLYDASSLQVLRHGMAHGNGTFGQVVLNDTAMRERKFELIGVGTRVKVCSTRPSTHTDKFGGTSSSMLAEVIGIGIIEPESVLQREPFLTVMCDDDDGLFLPPIDAPAGVGTAISAEKQAEWQAALTEAATACASLSEMAETKMTPPPSQSTPPSTLLDCVDRVVRLRNELHPPDEDVESTLRLLALACTAHLPGESRVQAMELAQQGELSRLLALVTELLQAEAGRRRARKALEDAFKGAE
jgi:hypothetical protein